MISKLRFSAVAVLMLVLLGFGFNNQAQAQVGGDGLFCPAIPFSSGWLEVEVEPGVGAFPDFSGALFGTVDSLIGGPLHGGMDWQHVDFTTSISPTPTNEIGSQLVSWWTQRDGRNTSLQVTNAVGGTWVHVHIFNQDCIEIRDFCDFYTEFDTHVYNFGDLVSNGGQDLGEANLQGNEGFVTVTAVTDGNCSDSRAIYHNQLAGNTFIKSVSDSDYMYGFANYHRRAVCDDEIIMTTVNLIQNGSFQNGDPFGPWVLNQGNSGPIQESNISVGTVPIPLASGPDADDPNSNLWMGFAVSACGLNGASGFCSPPYQGGPFSELASPNLIVQGPSFETNVTVVTSNIFTTDGPETALYDISMLFPGDFGDPNPSCESWAMVCVIDDSIPDAAAFEDCNCYQFEDAPLGQSPTGNGCVPLGTDFNFYNVSGAGANFTFEAGRNGFVTNETLDINDAGTYAVQYMTAIVDNGADDCADNFPEDNTGAFVDNFRVIVTETEIIPCDGILDGSEFKFLDMIVPNRFAGQFDAPSGTAGGDAVHINFYDEYLPSYSPQAAFINAVVGIYNDVEQFESCGEAEVCFIRLGVDESVILSDNFVGPPTTAPPTTPPTMGPTETPTVPPTTTPGGGGGGNGSCAIAGGPVQLGTAFANVLIPLVPVAFVFGIRAMRRRKK